MKQYVIVGGGVASIGCIEGIRSIDKDGNIVYYDENGCIKGMPCPLFLKGRR